MPMVPADLGAVGARLLSVLPPKLAGVWLMFMMWSVMMVAMMLPSASSMILTYAAMVRSRPDSSAYAPWIFAGSYLVIWTLFSAAATAGQLLLENASLLYGASRTTSAVGAVLLIVAGLYQLTPFKNVCLAHCRSPLGFFMTEWRSGVSGAFIMGLKHGMHCLGCCWMLMGLLFVFGAMNLIWIAALSILVLLEKLAPFGHTIARASGVAMLVGAIALAVYR
jgi:predicted metal-binding membrane protein